MSDTPKIPKDDLGYPIAGWEELLDRANAAEDALAESKQHEKAALDGYSKCVEQLRLSNEENAKLRQTRLAMLIAHRSDLDAQEDRLQEVCGELQTTISQLSGKLDKLEGKYGLRRVEISELTAALKDISGERYEVCGAMAMTQSAVVASRALAVHAQERS